MLPGMVTMVVSCGAQDTKYRTTGQQILSPECLTLRGARQGGFTPRTDVTHQQLLNDITQWRDSTLNCGHAAYGFAVARRNSISDAPALSSQAAAVPLSIDWNK